MSLTNIFSGAQEATWQELVGAQKRQCRKGINLCWAARQNKEEDDQVVCKVLKTEESNMIVLCLQRNWTCVLQCFYGELTLYTHSFFCLTGMNIIVGEPKSLSGSSFFFFFFGISLAIWYGFWGWQGTIFVGFILVLKAYKVIGMVGWWWNIVRERWAYRQDMVGL